MSLFFFSAGRDNVTVQQANPPTTEPVSSCRPSGVKKRDPKKRDSSYWTVNVTDGKGVTREQHLRVQDVYVLPDNHRIDLEWHFSGQPIGQSGGLYSKFAGALAADCQNFPISYGTWADVPPFHKQLIWETLQSKFDVSTEEQKNYILEDLGTRWSDNRSRLFYTFYQPEWTFEQNVLDCPHGIPREQWASFLKYRLEPEPWEVETGEQFSRAKMFTFAHTKKDETFVNEEAKELSSRVISGRVRGMGFVLHENETIAQKNERDYFANDVETNMKVLRLRRNMCDSESMLEVERVKREMKMLKVEVEGAARQDQVYALKQRDTLRREQSKKSEAAALLKEKDEIINQVMAE